MSVVAIAIVRSATIAPFGTDANFGALNQEARLGMSASVSLAYELGSVGARGALEIGTESGNVLEWSRYLHVCLDLMNVSESHSATSS